MYPTCDGRFIVWRAGRGVRPVSRPRKTHKRSSCGAEDCTPLKRIKRENIPRATRIKSAQKCCAAPEMRFQDFEASGTETGLGRC